MHTKAAASRFNIIITFVLLISSFVLSTYSADAYALDDAKNYVTGKPVKQDSYGARLPLVVHKDKETQDDKYNLKDTGLNPTINHPQVILPSRTTIPTKPPIRTDKPKQTSKLNVSDKPLLLNQKLIRQNFGATNIKTLSKNNDAPELKAVVDAEEKGIMLEE